MSSQFDAYLAAARAKKRPPASPTKLQIQGNGPPKRAVLGQLDLNQNNIQEARLCCSKKLSANDRPCKKESNVPIQRGILSSVNLNIQRVAKEKIIPTVTLTSDLSIQLEHPDSKRESCFDSDEDIVHSDEKAIKCNSTGTPTHVQLQKDESQIELNYSDEDEDDEDILNSNLNSNFGALNSEEWEEWLKKNVCPADYDYAGFNINKSKKQPDNYDVEMHINFSKDKTEIWLKALEKKYGNDYRCRKTFPTMSKARYTFKVEYRCHHNTMAGMPSSKTKNPHYKHVECPFLLRISLKNTNMTRSSDKLLKSHPCEVTMLNVLHNHPIWASDAMRHRRPSDEVVVKFTSLFKQGHSPSSALNTHKFDLQEEHGSNYITAAGDGSLCPSLKWCFYKYKKLFKQTYGAQDGSAMMESLTQFVSDYNKECASECAKVWITDEDYVVVIVTPLMKKVHKLIRGSGEIAFVDSGGGMDRHLSRVFMIMTPSVAGALPLGVVITSSEAEVVVSKAFELFSSILPEDAFHGKGLQGPSIFMTDDSRTLRNSLKAIFPAALLLLCIFHVLQAVWRWLLDSKHKIDKVDKPVLYDLFKGLINAETEEDLSTKNEALKSHPVTEKYPNAQSHFKDMMDRAPEWAKCYRRAHLTRGHNTNNYCEATMRILKDFIFFRCKAYSVVQLFHFLTTRLDKYFERRIVAVINNRVENYVKSRYHIKKEKLIPLSAEKVSESVYTVHNSESEKSYTVNMDVEICTCPVGISGAPCKHQYCVVTQFNLSSQQFLPFVDIKAKKLLYKLISDSSTELPNEWFSSLKSGLVNPFTVPVSPSESNDISDGEELTSRDQEPEIEEISDKSVPAEATPTDFPERIAMCHNQIDNFSEFLKHKLETRPDLYLEAVEKMMGRFDEECKTDSAAVTALHTFNRHSNPNAVRAVRNIPITPAALARQKMSLGGAKNYTITGRPPDSVRIVPEHGYQAKSSTQQKFTAPRPASKMPHCISQRVAAYAFK